MKKKEEKVGEYKGELDDPELLDDYRYANYGILKFPLNGADKPPVLLAQDFWLGKGGIFWDGVPYSFTWSRSTS
jgi:hypothetical protein